MVANPAEVLALTCKTCRWRVDGEHTVGVMQAHVETEHPEQVTEDGDPHLLFELVAYCLRCGTRMESSYVHDMGDFNLLTYECPKDHRTYRLRQAK